MPPYGLRKTVKRKESEFEKDSKSVAPSSTVVVPLKLNRKEKIPDLTSDVLVKVVENDLSLINDSKKSKGQNYLPVVRVSPVEEIAKSEVKSKSVLAKSSNPSSITKAIVKHKGKSARKISSPKNCSISIKNENNLRIAPLSDLEQKSNFAVTSKTVLDNAETHLPNEKKSQLTIRSRSRSSSTSTISISSHTFTEESRDGSESCVEVYNTLRDKVKLVSIASGGKYHLRNAVSKLPNVRIETVPKPSKNLSKNATKPVPAVKDIAKSEKPKKKKEKDTAPIKKKVSPKLSRLKKEKFDKSIGMPFESCIAKKKSPIVVSVINNDPFSPDEITRLSSSSSSLVSCPEATSRTASPKKDKKRNRKRSISCQDYELSDGSQKPSKRKRGQTSLTKVRNREVSLQSKLPNKRLSTDVTVIKTIADVHCVDISESSPPEMGFFAEDRRAVATESMKCNNKENKQSKLKNQPISCISKGSSDEEGISDDTAMEVSNHVEESASNSKNKEVNNFEEMNVFVSSTVRIDSKGHKSSDAEEISSSVCNSQEEIIETRKIDCSEINTKEIDDTEEINASQCENNEIYDTDKIDVLQCENEIIGDTEVNNLLCENMEICDNEEGSASRNKEINSAEVNASKCENNEVYDAEEVNSLDNKSRETSEDEETCYLDHSKEVFKIEESSTLEYNETDTLDSEDMNASEGKETNFVTIDEDESDEESFENNGVCSLSTPLEVEVEHNSADIEPDIVLIVNDLVDSVECLCNFGSNHMNTSVSQTSCKSSISSVDALLRVVDPTMFTQLLKDYRIDKNSDFIDSVSGLPSRDLSKKVIETAVKHNETVSEDIVFNFLGGDQQNNVEVSIDVCNIDVPSGPSILKYLHPSFLPNDICFTQNDSSENKKINLLELIISLVEESVIVEKYTISNSPCFKCVKCLSSFSELKDCCNHYEECIASFPKDKDVLKSNVLWVCTVCYSNFTDKNSLLEHKNSCLVPPSTSTLSAEPESGTVVSDTGIEACFSLNNNGDIHSNKKSMSGIAFPIQDATVSEVPGALDNSSLEFTCPACKKLIRCSYDLYVQHLHEHLEYISQKTPPETPVEDVSRTGVVEDCSEGPQILSVFSVTENSTPPPEKPAETKIFPSQTKRVSNIMREVGLIRAKHNKKPLPNRERVLDTKPRILQKQYPESRYIPGFCEPCGQVLQFPMPGTGGTSKPTFVDGKLCFTSKLVCNGCHSKHNMNFSLPSKSIESTYQYHLSNFFNTEDRIARKSVKQLYSYAARHGLDVDSLINRPCTSTLIENTDFSDTQSSEHFTQMDTDFSIEEPTSHYLESTPHLDYMEKNHPETNCNLLSNTSSFQYSPASSSQSPHSAQTEEMDVHNVCTSDKSPEQNTLGSNEVKFIDDIFQPYDAYGTPDGTYLCAACFEPISQNELVHHFKTQHNHSGNTLNLCLDGS